MRITVRVRPGASRTRVGGRWGDGEALVVAVTAPAVDGRASAAVCAAVADAFGVRAREVTVAAGERSRTKVLEIELGDAPGRARLAELLDRH